jgi:hypothetical protein
MTEETSSGTITGFCSGPLIVNLEGLSVQLDKSSNPPKLIVRITEDMDDLNIEVWSGDA